MDPIYSVRKESTGWMQLAIVIAVTFIAFYYIKSAFAKPYAELQLHNEIRIAEIYGTGEFEDKGKTGLEN